MHLEYYSVGFRANHLKIRYYTRMKWFKKHVFIFVVIGALFVVYAILVPFAVVQYGKHHIYAEQKDIPPYEVGIVFGAGLRFDGKPSDVLKDRLATAADLYRSGKIKKIVVSGDNRTETYNEPSAMFSYLVAEEGISEKDVVRDYAGRRTYDTCIRAQEVFGVEEALLITQGFHLSRAIWTCNAIGVESAGFSATVQQYESDGAFKLREILAIHRAMIDLYIWRPAYVGGEKESLNVNTNNTPGI